MFTRVIIALVAIVVAFAVLGVNGQTVLIERHPSAVAAQASGKQTFETYCASCHGVDGQGRGPAASAFQTVPPDLTQLTAANDGKYLESKLIAIIVGSAGMPAAHGSKEMPVWGDIFRSTSGADSTAAQVRVASVVAYIRSMHGK